MSADVIDVLETERAIAGDQSRLTAAPPLGAGARFNIPSTPQLLISLFNRLPNAHYQWFCVDRRGFFVNDSIKCPLSLHCPPPGGRANGSPLWTFNGCLSQVVTLMLSGSCRNHGTWRRPLIFQIYIKPAPPKLANKWLTC